MEHQLIAIDISESADLLKLADDVASSGVSRVLMRDGEAIALVSPLADTAKQSRHRTKRDPMRALEFIGIGDSGGSDVARFKHEYLADASDHRNR